MVQSNEVILQLSYRRPRAWLPRVHILKLRLKGWDRTGSITPYTAALLRVGDAAPVTPGPRRLSISDVTY